MRIGVYGLCGALLFLQRSLIAQTTSPTNDAAVMYEAADAVVARSVAANMMCPANSLLRDTSYPYSTEWLAMEKADFAANGKAREFAHQARSMDHANWPPIVEPKPDYSSPSINFLRELANDLADAAVYQHLQGDDAAAVETIRDLLHFSDLLKSSTDKKLVRLLVSVGIDALSVDRLNVITSSAVFTNDSTKTKNLQITTARDLARQLLDHGDAANFVNSAIVDGDKNEIDKCILVEKRVNTDLDMAALSLACHLYRFNTGHWPKNLDDIHDFVPALPIDPFGDGKQLIGYVLIKGGLPDGGDRPLVYSRENSKDGMFIRNDRPFYSYYRGDGAIITAAAQEKQCGQFRDVTSWGPDKNKPPASINQPLQ